MLAAFKVQGVESMAEPHAITIVLVHGSFAESLSNWKPVLELLLAKGYKVVAAPNPLRGVTSDAAYVASFLNTIDGPIILVGHSYGGAVISNAATGNQSVKALVYVAAFAPDTGESVATLLRRFPGSTVEANTAAPILLADGSRDLYFQPDRFREQYAADLPEAETKLLALTQRPMAERAMTEVSDVVAWKAIPSWFIFGTRDNSIPANLLAFMAERAGSMKTVTMSLTSASFASATAPFNCLIRKCGPRASRATLIRCSASRNIAAAGAPTSGKVGTGGGSIADAAAASISVADACSVSPCRASPMPRSTTRASSSRSSGSP
jgi:pimeloyl-ACP methyl ester carboxylesterase